MSMYVLSAYMYVHRVHVWCLQRDKRVLNPLDINICELPSICVWL